MASQSEAGVGVLFNPSMYRFVAELIPAVDYVAVIPDRGLLDHGTGSRTRFEMLPQAAALLERLARERPVVLHGIGLSICSAEFFDQAYAENLIVWAQRLRSPWISEHLSFTRVGTGHELNAAIPLPVPYDRDVLALVGARVEFITDRFDRPFLLENNVYYFQYPEQELTEQEFLNCLCHRHGCGILLDLHNLYTNAVNHGFSAVDYLSKLDMTKVTEIHVAGGVRMMGFHTDSHTGPVLEEVWSLLDRSLPLATNLRGITFEFHESSFQLLGERGMFEQVQRARTILAGRSAESRASA